MQLPEILISAAVGIISGGITAYWTTRLKIKEEEKKWQKEFAQKYAELVAENPNAARKVSQQFGIAVLVIRANSPEEQKNSRKFFVPPNSRLLVGRSDECDIILSDSTASRKHMAFKSNDKDVFVENLGATNAFTVNELVVKERQKLRSGDQVVIGQTSLTYVDLK